MLVKLPQHYTGKQILDAFRTAILAENTRTVVWSPEVKRDRVVCTVSDSLPPKVDSVIYQRLEATLSRNEPTMLGGIWRERAPKRMQGGKLWLSPMNEAELYKEFELTFANVSPEQEADIVGHDLGLLAVRLIERLTVELRRDMALAA
jgi:hypothetical protein